jgi:hypothetical protein
MNEDIKTRGFSMNTFSEWMKTGEDTIQLQTRRPQRYRKT